jgi:3-deoxy-D-manno-octulosonate 8-phosphate phosphatase (KDO 8-P phosphatase)
MPDPSPTAGQHSPAPRAAPAEVKLLALDVDGVLTDGSILIDDRGVETKRFNIHDGLGMRIWAKMGFHLAVITGRSGGAIQHRMAELGVGELIHGCADKRAALNALTRRLGITPAAVAFIGDDWPDLAVMAAVGYPIAVADADQRVRAAAAFVTSRPGGRGAVREAVEHLLAAKGLLDRAAALYHAPAPPAAGHAG